MPPPRHHFQIRKSTHKRIFIACVSGIHTFWSSPLLWCSYTVLSFSLWSMGSDWTLVEMSMSNKSDPISELSSRRCFHNCFWKPYNNYNCYLQCQKDNLVEEDLDTSKLHNLQNIYLVTLCFSQITCAF